MLGDTPEQGPPEPYKVEARLFAEVDRILEEIQKKSTVEFVVVTNEVGWGVVPDNQLGRAFRDFLGLTNQSFALKAARVTLMCSGIPMQIK